MRNLTTSVYALYASGQKYEAALIIGYILAPFIRFFEEFIFSDWHFVVFLCVLVFWDTLLGILAAWKLKKLSELKLKSFLEKIILYGAALSTIHVITHFTVENQPANLFKFIDATAYGAVLALEAISIFRKISVLRPKLVPKWIMRALEQFNETGKLPSIKSEENPSTENHE